MMFIFEMLVVWMVFDRQKLLVGSAEVHSM